MKTSRRQPRLVGSNPTPSATKPASVRERVFSCPGSETEAGASLSLPPLVLRQKLLVLVARRSAGGANQNNDKGNVGDDEEQGEDAQHQTNPAGNLTDGCLSPI